MGLLVLALTAVIVLLLLRGIFVHLRWWRNRRQERLAAQTYLILASRDPILTAEDPWNCNHKSDARPMGWWVEPRKEMARARAFLEANRLHANAAFFHALAILPLVMVTGLMALMLAVEDVPQLCAQAGADIAQVETGGWETATVFLSPKVRPWHLEGPYTDSQPALLTRYGMIGKDTGHRWRQVYVPWGLDFALDEHRLFNENYSVAWNAENAQMYEVAYTSQFHFVVSLRPVEPPEDFWE